MARVETVSPGDRIVIPHGPELGFEVVAVETYDDGTFVIVYGTGKSSRVRFGAELVHTANVLGSVQPLRAGDRVAIMRDARAGRREPRQPTA